MSFLGLCGLCFEFISFWVHEFFWLCGTLFYFGVVWALFELTSFSVYKPLS